MSETVEQCDFGDEFYCNHGVVCPYCKTYSDVDDNEFYHLYDEGTNFVECPNCNEEFEVESSVTYLFSIRKDQVDE